MTVAIFVTYNRLEFKSKLPIIPDKKRNTPLRTVQLSGRSQVLGQFSLYDCKGMSGTAASHVFCNLASKLCLRKLVMNQVGGQIVKSQEISMFIMLSCRISSSNRNHLRRPNCTQTLILYKIYLLIYHTQLLNAR